MLETFTNIDMKGYSETYDKKQASLGNLLNITARSSKEKNNIQQEYDVMTLEQKRTKTQDDNDETLRQ